MGEPFSRTSSLCCMSAILMLNTEGETGGYNVHPYRLGDFISIELECIRFPLQHFLHTYVHVGPANISDNIYIMFAQ